MGIFKKKHKYFLFLNIFQVFGHGIKRNKDNSPKGCVCEAKSCLQMPVQLTIHYVLSSVSIPTVTDGAVKADKHLLSTVSMCMSGSGSSVGTYTFSLACWMLKSGSGKYIG